MEPVDRGAEETVPVYGWQVGTSVDGYLVIGGLLSLDPDGSEVTMFVGCARPNCERLVQVTSCRPDHSSIDGLRSDTARQAQGLAGQRQFLDGRLRPSVPRKPVFAGAWGTGGARSRVRPTLRRWISAAGGSDILVG